MRVPATRYQKRPASRGPFSFGARRSFKLDSAALCSDGRSTPRCRRSGRSARAFQRFIESPNRPKYLFLRNSRRKTVTHFSWNCSNAQGAQNAAGADRMGWLGRT
ncbi:hypothetical protein EN827_12910 [Mesorhizobium sp. M1D.F.Ca.ET.184.01.1.1]|nr:hypothetical protein EN874_012910 [Mesorhizobium sp. M1D.F.Ca.ET.231.01.1.1]TGP33585.1 hypothetical protein EN877_12915 [Mesorhizobium sp. M1D.F.Ca.ET.234.01.1.1]TGS46952.1 hypothetical protein EN827_12910 [Mesorhizobium sp. M1D.F.Ca.ET.184.01.1.1]TGS62211.1 hypothetical protein EN826_012910 [Mesorhizobium sp. M1D.F.Ca.ET.183.01.1.1]